MFLHFDLKRYNRIETIQLFVEWKRKVKNHYEFRKKIINNHLDQDECKLCLF